MSRVLVTGANGHLGANTVRALLKHGHEPVPFVRPTSDLSGLEGLGLDYAFGDVKELDSLVAAADGVDVIIHSAAVFRYWPIEPEKIMHTALGGVRHVFETGKRAGVQRIIYTSSTYAIGFSDDFNKPRTAVDWNDDPRSPYAIAKVRAEREAWRLSEESGIPLISLCPAGFWGPYDYRITPATSWIQGMVNGTSPIIDTGGSFVDVRDAAEVHALCVDGGELGKRYVVNGQDLRQRDMAEIIQQLTGVRHLHLNIGRGPTLATAGLMELAARASGWRPMATRAFIRETLGKYLVADGRETNEIFGLQPRQGVEMISDTIRWLLFLGALGKRRSERLSEDFPPEPEWFR